MKRMPLYGAAVLAALVPAAVGLWGNGSFSHAVPVNVPAKAQIASTDDRPRSTPTPTRHPLRQPARVRRPVTTTVATPLATSAPSPVTTAVVTPPVTSAPSQVTTAAATATPAPTTADRTTPGRDPGTTPTTPGRAPPVRPGATTTVPVMTLATTTAEVGRVDTDPTTELPVITGDPAPREQQAPPAAGSPASGAPASGDLPWTTLSTAGHRSGQPAADESPLRVRRIVVQLAVSVLVVLLAVALGGILAAQRLAEREAVNDAANTADVIAEAVVQPSLTNALAAGRPGAVATFDAIVRRQILGRDVVRVKLWSPEGTVLYADEPQLIGQRFELDEPQLDALANPATHADVSDLDRSENAFEPGDKLLEVYRPVWAPDGTEVLFEMYTSYDQVGKRQSELWRGFAGVVLTSLLLLVILLAPVVWHLLGRIRRAQGQRELLLQRSVDASEEERRRIAASLHDGPVQDLVASSFVVAGAAERAAAAGDQPGARALAEVSAPCAPASVPCAHCSSTSTRRASAMPGCRPRSPISPRRCGAKGSPSTSMSTARTPFAWTRTRSVSSTASPRSACATSSGMRGRAQPGCRSTGARPRSCSRSSTTDWASILRPSSPARRAATSACGRWPMRPRPPVRCCGSRLRRDRAPAGSSRCRSTTATERPMTTVLLVDDHRMVRTGLAALLETAEGIEVVGQAADGEEAVRLAVQTRPDVVLMDLSMPVVDGVEATRRVLAELPDTKIVVLTSFSDRERVAEALRAGAVGYLLKDCEPDELRSAIRAAAAGHVPLDPRVARVLLPAAAGGRPEDALSPREQEVLRLVAEGRANKQIGRALGISERTVKSHLGSVFRQIGVTDRTSAALWARDHLSGLRTDDSAG